VEIKDEKYDNENQSEYEKEKRYDGMVKERSKYFKQLIFSARSGGGFIVRESNSARIRLTSEVHRN